MRGTVDGDDAIETVLWPLNSRSGFDVRGTGEGKKRGIKHF